jgi:hypothetical protein
LEVAKGLVRRDAWEALGACVGCAQGAGLGCTEGDPNAISASVYPEAAAQAFLQGQEDEKDLPERYAYIWSAVMESALKTIPMNALPRLRGVAENRGLRYGGEGQLGEPGFPGEVSRLILGAPLYVEGA